MEKNNSSRLYTCPMCEMIYNQPYIMTTCGHIFCKKCIERVILLSVIKPNYDTTYIICPLCSRVTDTPSEDFTKDLEYAYEFELQIRKWQDQEFHLDSSDKITQADICKNHLKLLETFCLDDKEFTCWMCHNYNFSDDHRGHKVVGLEEAYRILRTDNIENLSLMHSMNKFVNQRLKYLDECRNKIRSDRSRSEKEINEYFDEIFKEFRILKAKKIQELNDIYVVHDEYMKRNEAACRKFIQLSKRVLEINPDSLYEVLKQYNMSTSFIKSIANGINFPPENEVNITLKTPNFSIITNAIEKCSQTMKILSTGLPPNVRERINPLFDSEILPIRAQNDMNLSVLPNYKSTELLFRLGEQKMIAKKFRDAVYHKGKTLILVQANKGYIFGGYSPIPWTEGAESNNWKASDEAFIFSLTDNKGREPLKLKIK